MDETASNQAAHSAAFGPVEDADQTRQAQHSQSNDVPTDINMNAFATRSQALTFDVAGKNYEAGSDRRRSMFDIIAAKEAGKA